MGGCGGGGDARDHGGESISAYTCNILHDNYTRHRRIAEPRESNIH